MIKGDPRTKKNSLRKYGKRILSSAAFEKYYNSALPQLMTQPVPPVPINRPVTVCVRYYMETRRAVDLVNLIQGTLDILKDAQILLDDSVLIASSYDGSRVYWDKNNPRAEICIMPFDEEPPWVKEGNKWNKEKRHPPAKSLRTGRTDPSVCKPVRRKRQG